LPGECAVYQWHSDTFSLPEGAEWLFSSPWCPNQGFAWGDKVLALQGHPEVTEELVQLWATDWAHLLDETQPSQQSRAQMLAELQSKVAAQQRVAEVFYRHWLRLAFPD
jgi:GMP synthase-like glutamine amidotransferase